MNMAIPVGTVACYINNRPFGWVTAARISESTPRNEIRGVDSLLPYEEAPTLISVSGSLSILRVRNSGGIEGAGILALPEHLQNEKYFTFAIVDIMTKQTLFKSNYCSVENQTWELPSKGIIVGSIQFKAMTWSNDFQQ